MLKLREHYFNFFPRLVKNYGYFIFLNMLIAVFSICGCISTVKNIEKSHKSIVWPDPPEVSRISFENMISRPEDLNIRRGIVKRFFTYLAGKEEISIVRPYGVETDSSGRIFVVDTSRKKILVFDVSNNISYSFPKKNIRLKSPIDIAVDDQHDRIYITDSSEKVIHIFTDKGKTYLGDMGRGILERPTGIAINKKTSELLVVDTLSSNIFRYELGTHRFIGIAGKKGELKNEFHFPTNIFTAEDGTICVSDSLNFRIQIFSPEWHYLGGFGRAGDTPGHFSRPRGVAMDSDGNIYVVDALFDNIQVFDKSGLLLMAFGEHGNNPGEFWLPNGIYIDENDRIFVSDSYNKRVQVFQYIKKEAMLK